MIVGHQDLSLFLNVQEYGQRGLCGHLCGHLLCLVPYYRSRQVCALYEGWTYSSPQSRLGSMKSISVLPNKLNHVFSLLPYVYTDLQSHLLSPDGGSLLR